MFLDITKRTSNLVMNNVELIQGATLFLMIMMTLNIAWVIKVGIYFHTTANGVSEMG